LRDLRHTSALRLGGWTVLRYWEHDDPERVAADVLRAVRRTAVDRA
jgi:DNA mismatch endonuclease (patch repair protein)